MEPFQWSGRNGWRCSRCGADFFDEDEARQHDVVQHAAERIAAKLEKE